MGFDEVIGQKEAAAAGTRGAIAPRTDAVRSAGLWQAAISRGFCLLSARQWHTIC